MKKTPWFEMSTPPKRKGLYECNSCSKKHKWDGKGWHIEGGVFSPLEWFVRNSKWRGLMTKDGK